MFLRRTNLSVTPKLLSNLGKKLSDPVTEAELANWASTIRQSPIIPTFLIELTIRDL